MRDVFGVVALAGESGRILTKAGFGCNDLKLFPFRRVPLWSSMPITRAAGARPNHRTPGLRTAVALVIALPQVQHPTMPIIDKLEAVLRKR